MKLRRQRKLSLNMLITLLVVTTILKCTQLVSNIFFLPKSNRIYGTSKLANILFTKELARRLKARGDSNIIVNSLHPGAVQTGLFRNIPYFGKVIKLLIGLLYYSPKVRNSLICFETYLYW